MNNVLLRIKEMRLALTPCEKLVADYILNNVKDACDMNIRELSAMTNTSPSSIVRFCRKLGFDGFQDFSKSLLYNAAAIAQDRLVLKENTITKDKTFHVHILQFPSHMNGRKPFVISIESDDAQWANKTLLQKII